ncbi:MAG: protease modulator HflK, partial [Gammaproteobacteria bacterium]|nr:protease modulator HflK [Gammaproteobacteria bacterium]
MPWNPSDDNKGVKPRRGGARGNSGGKRWRALRQLWQAGPRARAALYAAAAGFLAMVWLASGCYQLEASERGVLQRFGAYTGERGSGFGWHLPWPIETLTVVDLGTPNSAAFQARMLTSDGMLVNVTGDIPYRFTNARAAIFADRDPDALLHDLGEALARAAVAQRPIAALMDEAKRAPLSAGLTPELQRLLDSIGAGLRVQGLDLTDVQVPEPVLPAQRDLVQAGRDNERVAREAQTYAAELIPSAQELARKQRLEAESRKLESIGAAEADAARFGPIAAAYARAPAATRSQLYVETMEAILAHSRKIIVDGKGINTLLLPLDKLGDAA